MTVRRLMTCQFLIKDKIQDAVISEQNDAHTLWGLGRHDPPGFFGTWTKFNSDCYVLMLR